MGADNRFTVDEIIDASRHRDGGTVEAFENGRWVVAKPLPYPPTWQDRVAAIWRRLYSKRGEDSNG